MPSSRPTCARVTVFAAEDSTENSATIDVAGFYQAGKSPVEPRLRLTVQLKRIDGVAGLVARAVLEVDDETS